MTIAIIKVTTINDPFTSQPDSRSAEFVINSGGGPWYHYFAGGLPLAGGVQALLDAQEADLYAQASASAANLATTYQVSLADARAWYVGNAGAKADVFDTTVTQLNTNITNLVNASFPSASAAVKTGWIRTLMSGLLNTRSYTFEKELV